MPRMRTIKEAIRYIKETDPDTALTEHALRGMVNTGQIPHVPAGRKFLLDLDSLDEYLRGERAAPAQPAREPLTPGARRLIVGGGARGR